MFNLISKACIYVTDLKEFRQGKSGATAMEYALMAAGIAVAIIAALFALGDEVKSLFGDVQTQLDGAGK